MKQDKNGTEKLLEKIEDLNKKIKFYEEKLHNLEKENQRIKEKEEYNFALFNYNPMSTIVVDREGRVVKSNKAKLTSGDRLPKIGDIMYKDYAAEHVIDMYQELINCIATGKVKTFPQLPYKGKYLSVTIAPFSKGAIITSQDITERVIAERDRINLIADLRRALEEVETLRGLLPICASCKKIRDDEGYWKTIEDYFSQRSKLDFSHTLCPD